MALVLGILGVLLVNAVFRVRREVGFYESDMRRDHHVMGRALTWAITEVWSSEGEARARRLVREVNERDSQPTVRWVWLDGETDDDTASVLAGPELAKAEEGREIGQRLLVDGKEQLVSVTPITVPSGRMGAIEISENFDGEESFIRSTIESSIIQTGVLAAVCTGLTIWLGLWFVGRPMRLLMAHARRIGGGDLTQSLSLPQRDEVGELAKEMDAMCKRLAVAQRAVASEAEARIRALEQLRHADRLATVGKLASGMAHEIGAPLQVISGRAQMILDGTSSADEVREHAAIIHEQSRRITAIIRQLLDFARRGDGAKTVVRTRIDVGALLRSSRELLRTLVKRSRSALRLDDESFAESAFAHVDPEPMRQVLANLVVNAAQASVGAGAEISVRLRRLSAQPPPDLARAEGPHVCIEVEDHGHGIPADLIGQVFEPFFTTKDIGDGTGLGLAVAYGIVRDHGGWIEVKSRTGADSGTVFSVFLPTSDT